VFFQQFTVIERLPWTISITALDDMPISRPSRFWLMPVLDYA